MSTETAPSFSLTCVMTSPRANHGRAQNSGQYMAHKLLDSLLLRDNVSYYAVRSASTMYEESQDRASPSEFYHHSFVSRNGKISVPSPYGRNRWSMAAVEVHSGGSDLDDVISRYGAEPKRLLRSAVGKQWKRSCGTTGFIDGKRSLHIAGVLRTPELHIRENRLRQMAEQFGNRE